MREIGIMSVKTNMMSKINIPHDWKRALLYVVCICPSHLEMKTSLSLVFSLACWTPSHPPYWRPSTERGLGQFITSPFDDVNISKHGDHRGRGLPFSGSSYSERNWRFSFVPHTRMFQSVSKSFLPQNAPDQDSWSSFGWRRKEALCSRSEQKSGWETFLLPS